MVELAEALIVLTVSFSPFLIESRTVSFFLRLILFYPKPQRNHVDQPPDSDDDKAHPDGGRFIWEAANEG